MAPDISIAKNSQTYEFPDSLYIAHFSRARQFIGRGALTLSLAVAGIGASAIERPDIAHAAVEFVNDYPNQGAMPYNTANFDWWVDENGDGQANVTPNNAVDNDETMSSRGYNYRNCTDGAAYWAMKYTGVNVGGWGNAKDWAESASSHVISPGNSNDIEPGDIAQSADGGFGHVGFVTQVNKNSQGNVTSIKVAELNKLGTGEYTHDTYTTKNAAGNFVRPGAGDWDHFIDLNGSDKGLNGESLDDSGAPTAISRPAAIAYNGALNVFIRGGDGQIYAQYWNGTNWTGFSSIGGNMASDPAVIVNGNALNVFARGTDGKIYTKYNNGSGWQAGWADLGATTMRGNPRVMLYGSELTVFALGTDNHPYKKTWTAANGWGSWSSLGNYMGSSPAALQYGSELDVIMRGGDNQIYKDTWNGRSWGGFGTLGNPGGGGAAGNPDVMQFGSRFDIWTNTAQNRLYKRTWNGSGWTDWADMGGGLAGDPDAMQYNNDINVFARGTDGQIYTRYYSASGKFWSGWTSIGGNIAGEPTAIQYGTELSVFATGTDGKTYKNTFFPTKGWGGFTALPG